MKKNYTLKRELTFLMILTSVCTLLSVCAAVFYVFFSFFFQKAQEDIEYVLRYTSQQYEAHMQFIEDSVIAIRHNTVLDDFFQKEEYDLEEIEPQLSYSMELFSERNMVERQLPFVTGIYLFNNGNECIYEHYYATTLAAGREQKRKYENMQQEFKSTSDQYACLSDKDELNIFFRIYDENMREKGIGIVQISQSAVAKVLETVQLYHNGGWAVLDKNDQLLKPTLFIVLVGLIVVLGIAFLVAYAISYRFTKPVTRMIQSIQAFGKPDLNARMEDSSIQEFHDMGIVFNEMADRIEYLITQVYEKEIVAARSQVKYLQSQINPHFQFNILAMLSLKAKMAGNEEVYDGLNAFSRLMQGKIFREKEIKIKVKEELEIVQFYLYLQKSRYQDKLSYEVKLEDEKIGEDLIPRLLIEPLVENAVSHGLEPKRGKGNLQVLLYEREMLYIWVKDDGVGVCRNQTKAEENKEKTPHTHVGWENTKKMLRILYGDYYKFQVWSEPGKGTEIEIAVPIERGGNYVESGSSR